MECAVMTRSALTRDAVEQFVFTTLKEFGADPEAITLDESFDDLGMDSLDVTELGRSVKRDLGIEVTPRDLDDVLSVGQALTVIYAKAGL
jgi:acyl carrier protein